jgi:hypothetical protein
MQPILEHHDRTKFEIFGYGIQSSLDETSQQLIPHFDHWNHCKNWSDEKLVKRIKDDNLDILVDLGGYTASCKMHLMARRLAPVQAKILPITDKQAEYADQVRDQLRDAGFRVEVDDRNEKIGLKIREAEKGKVPYMLVVGKRESEANQVSVRKRSEGDLGAMNIQEVIDLIGNDMPIEQLTTSSNHE